MVTSTPGSKPSMAYTTGPASSTPANRTSLPHRGVASQSMHPLSSQPKQYQTMDDHEDHDDDDEVDDDDPEYDYDEPPTSSGDKGKQRAPGERPNEGAARDSTEPARGFFSTAKSAMGSGAKRVGGPRIKGACEGCKSAKVRCDWAIEPPDAKDRPRMCRRCVTNGMECRVPSRKVKKPPPPHDELKQRVNYKNERIAELLAALVLAPTSTSGNANNNYNNNTNVSPSYSNEQYPCPPQQRLSLGHGTQAPQQQQQQQQQHLYRQTQSQMQSQRDDSRLRNPYPSTPITNTNMYYTNANANANTNTIMSTTTTALAPEARAPLPHQQQQSYHQQHHPQVQALPQHFNVTNANANAAVPTIAYTTTPSSLRLALQPPQPTLSSGSASSSSSVASSSARQPHPSHSPQQQQHPAHPRPSHGEHHQQQQQQILIDAVHIDTLLPREHWDKKLPKEEKARKADRWVKEAVRALRAVAFPGGVPSPGPGPTMGDGGLDGPPSTAAVWSQWQHNNGGGAVPQDTLPVPVPDSGPRSRSDSNSATTPAQHGTAHPSPFQQLPLDVRLLLANDYDNVSENGDKVFANPRTVEEEFLHWEHAELAHEQEARGEQQLQNVHAPGQMMDEEEEEEEEEGTRGLVGFPPPGAVSTATTTGAVPGSGPGPSSDVTPTLGVGRGTSKYKVPEILERGLVNMKMAEELFVIYYDKINTIGFSVLDPKLHTLERVLRTSSLLFTTICAVASRHYPGNPTLFSHLLAAANRAAASAVNGPKTVETCQSYLILGIFCPPSRKFVDDRNYLFVGMALRIATDLRLHVARFTHPPPAHLPEPLARVLLNRARVWLNCYCTDRSQALQTGKPIALFTSTTQGGGVSIPFDVRTWWRCSPEWNLPQDFWVCAYAELLSELSGFHDLVFSASAYDSEGIKKEALDLDTISMYATKVDTIQNEWLRLKKQYFPHRTDPKLIWRDALWPFITSYLKLVVVSVGLREGMKKGMKQNNPFSNECIKAASAVLTQVVDVLAGLGYLRYCPEAWFIFIGFAAAFMFKIFRPRFSFMINPTLEKELVTLIERLIALLGSDNVAINDRHTPKLYARFLDGLLTEYKEGKAGGKSSPRTKAGLKVNSKLGAAVGGEVATTGTGTGATAATSTSTFSHAAPSVPRVEVPMSIAPMQVDPIMLAMPADPAMAATTYDQSGLSGMSGGSFSAFEPRQQHQHQHQQQHLMQQLSPSSRSTVAWATHDPSSGMPTYQQPQHSPSAQTFQPSPTQLTYQSLQPTPSTHYSSFSMDVDADLTNSQSVYWTVPIPPEFANAGYPFPGSAQASNISPQSNTRHSQHFGGSGSSEMHQHHHRTSAAALHQPSNIDTTAHQHPGFFNAPHGYQFVDNAAGAPMSVQPDSGPELPSMAILSGDSTFWHDGAMPGYFDTPYQPGYASGGGGGGGDGGMSAMEDSQGAAFIRGHGQQGQGVGGMMHGEMY